MKKVIGALLCMVGYAMATEDDENVLLTTMSVVENSSFPAPISLSAKTFVDLIKNSNVLVDKTMVLKEIFRPAIEDFDNFEFDVLRIFARPRGWGKTVMLSMVKLFCEMPMDEKRRTKLPINESMGYKLFHDGVLDTGIGKPRKLRQPLLISQDEHIMNKYQGRHPVVCFDLAGVKAKDFGDFLGQMAERFRRGFEIYDFDYMSKHTTNTSFEPSLLDRFALDKLVERINDKDLDFDVEYIAEMSLMLREYFKAYVLILVDNYDEPLLNILTSPVSHKAEFVFNVTLFYSKLFGKFDRVKFHVRSLFAGTIRMWHDVPLPRKDCRHEMRDGKCIHHSHGFKQHEIDMIFDYVDMPTELREKAALYYGGYQMAHRENVTYNPSSIAHFLASREVKHYWQSHEIIDQVLNEFLTVQKFRHFLKNRLSQPLNTRRIGPPRVLPLNETMVNRTFIEERAFIRLSIFFEDTESGVAGYYDESLHNSAMYLMRCAGYFTHYYEIPNLEVKEKLSSIVEDAIVPY